MEDGKLRKELERLEELIDNAEVELEEGERKLKEEEDSFESGTFFFFLCCLLMGM